VYMTWIDTYSTGLTDSSGTYLDTTFFGMYWASSTNDGQTWQRPAAKGYVALGWERISIDSATFQARFDTTTGIDDKEWIAVDRSNSPYHNTLYVAWTHLGVANYGVTVRRKLPGVDSMEPPVRVSSDNFLRVQYTSIGIDSKGGVHVTFMGTLDTIHYGIYQAYSSDGGKTFQPAVKISDADIPGTSPDAIANGDMIFGIRTNGNYPCPHLSIDTAVTGDLYEVWDALGTTSDEQHGTDIYFSRSTDSGATWSPARAINNDIDTESGNYIDHFYPSIAVNGKGMISVTWYDRREDPSNQIGRYYIAQSTDQGHTWTNAPVATQPMDFNYVMNVNQNFGIGEYTQVLTTSNYTIPVWSDGRDDAGNLRVYAAFINPANARVDRLSTIGQGLSLLANYPNPFKTVTKVGFTLESSAHARLYVTNIAGQQVASIFDGGAPAGEHDFTFDGSRLANGIYYLNLETDLGIARSAMTILR
ncbi:MAG: FlgD immunoglobulin-like domain containing protein, partial [Candidatus Kapaibacterium sp.]